MFYNKKYNNFSNSVDKPDGLAVLGILISVNGQVSFYFDLFWTFVIQSCSQNLSWAVKIIKGYKRMHENDLKR